MARHKCYEDHPHNHEERQRDVEGHSGQERNGKETDCQRKTSNGPTQPRDRHTSWHLVMSTEQSERGRSTGGVCMGGGLKPPEHFKLLRTKGVVHGITDTLLSVTEGLHSVLGGLWGQKQTVSLLICIRPDGAR